MNRYRYVDDVEVARAMGLAGERDRSAHLHVLDGKPLVGASSAKSIISKGEQLNQWYGDMAAVSGLGFPMQNIKAEYERCNVIQDRRERQKAKQALERKYPNFATARKAAIQSRDASAKTGTERHGLLEQYVAFCITNGGAPLPFHNGYVAIEKFIDWAVENVEEFYFTEANCYHEGLWVGGIADIGMRLKDGRRLVGDHKSSREAHPDQFLQCAMYDLLLAHSGILDRDGNKKGEWELADGYAIFPFRSDPFTPEFRWNVEKWRKAAEGTIEIYKLLEIN